MSNASILAQLHTSHPAAESFPVLVLIPATLALVASASCPALEAFKRCRSDQVLVFRQGRRGNTSSAPRPRAAFLWPLVQTTPI